MRCSTQLQDAQMKAYVYCAEILSKYDAGALSYTYVQGDVVAVQALLAKDGRLGNAQCWYRFPVTQETGVHNAESAICVRIRHELQASVSRIAVSGLNHLPEDVSPIAFGNTLAE